jgi:hypothetical protein
MKPDQPLRLMVFTHLEGKIGLRNIAEGHHDDRRADFGNGGIEMKALHEEFQENIIEEYCAQHRQEVAEKLRSTSHRGTLENDVSRERKANGEGEYEGKYECGDMGTDRHEGQHKVLLPENEVIADKKKENIKGGIRPAAGGIPESQLVHEPAERRVEKIDDIFDGLSHGWGNI